MPAVPEWKFAAVSTGEEPVYIGGADVWKCEHEWRSTKVKVTVNDPLHYLQKVTFHVYEIGSPGAAVFVFGFAEMTPGVYGFWVRSLSDYSRQAPSQPPPRNLFPN
jgi:hypothetical protein